jgi:PAS domain S-box-containing protein
MRPADHAEQIAMSAVAAADAAGSRPAPNADSSSSLVEHTARDLVVLAGLACDAPHAVLTLPGVHVTWSRDASGGEAGEAPDSSTFDEYVRLVSGVFEVADARIDERFGGSAAARRRAQTVSYAGVSICAPDGHVLGSLAVYGPAPRSLTAAQRATLVAVAREVTARLALCEELVVTREIIDSAPVAIYLTDERGDVTIANPEYRRLLQLGPDDSLRDWARGVHPEDRARVEDAWTEFCADPRSSAFQYRSAAGEAQSRVLAEQVNVARTIPGYVGAITDVTERAATSEKLARVETLFRNIVEQAPMGIAYADRSGRLLRCNPAYAQMLGYEPRELEGVLLSELNDPADATQDARELERVWRGELDSYSLEKRYRRKDGSTLWVRASTGLIRDGAGTPECSVCFDRDISQRKNVESALAESRKVLEAVVSDVPVAILACNLAGQLLVHNRAAAELFDIPAQDGLAAAGPGSYALGVDILMPDGTTPLSREARPLARALRGETVTNMEMLVRGENSERTTVSSARQIFGQHGETLGAVVVSQDVTDRRLAEIELERVHKQLLDASRHAGMAEVATNVLHNVGNVLNSVNVCVSRVSERLRQPRSAGLTKVAALLGEHDLANFVATDARAKQLPAYVGQLAELLASDQRMALEELADLQSHIEHIKETVMMQQSYAKLCGITEQVPVAMLVEDCLRMNSGALTRHGVTVRREIADLPPITVDKHKVLQILVNLVRNAKYACDESSRPDRLVILRVEDAGAMVRLSVIDNGVGIAAGDMPQLFSHGFTTRKSGHGFGLHSAALAARQLGGALTAHSAGRGHGATFVLELPKDASHAQGS